MRPHLLVAGAGIGGLAAALALARKGFGVTVLEQSTQFGDVGAGIQISPNASRLLAGWGLLPALEAMAVRPEALEIHSHASGRLLFRSALGEQAVQRYGAPYLHLHRADLHRVLLDAARGEAAIAIHADSRVERVEHVGQGAEAVRVETAQGQRHQGDLLIGADGIRSVVRSALFGPEQPRFTGNVAWRGLVPIEALAPALRRRVAGLWMGPGAHFVHYLVRGGSLANFVAVIEQRGWEVESWTERGDQAELIRAFGDWPSPVRELVHAADPETCFRWALFDRAPMPQWSRGAVTLLGDACHPTLPFMAQGACMAIEDAAVLAECLAETASREAPLATALPRYEALRRVRTAEIQLGSRRNSRLYHLSGMAARLRDLGAPLAAPGNQRKLDALFGHDALAAMAGRPQA